MTEAADLEHAVRIDAGHPCVLADLDAQSQQESARGIAQRRRKRRKNGWPGLDKDALRALADSHRTRIKSGVVVLASAEDSKVSIVVAVTPDLTKRVPAGQVVKQIAPIVGGGGGGRPDFAEAGGKDASKIEEMLAAARNVLQQMLQLQ